MLKRGRGSLVYILLIVIFLSNIFFYNTLNVTAAIGCEGCKHFIRGDANGDCRIDISDVISVTNYLFAGGSVPCELAADSNGDGKVDIADAIWLTNYLFKEGKAPPEPFPEPSECSKDIHCGIGSCVNFKCIETDFHKEKNEKKKEYTENSATILPEFQNPKEKTAFLVSDKDWHNVLSLVPTTVWTDDEGRVHYYPTLVYHEDVPAASTIRFKKELFLGINSPEVEITLSDDAIYDINNICELEFRERAKLCIVDVGSDRDTINENDEFTLTYRIKNILNSPADISESMIKGIEVINPPPNTEFISVSVENTIVPVGETAELFLKLRYKPIQTTSFDIDSINNFFRQYKPEKLYLVGEVQEGVKEKIQLPNPGGEIPESIIEEISADDIITQYWDSIKELVIVDYNNYEDALMASVYASLKNIPIIFVKQRNIESYASLIKRRDVIIAGEMPSYTEDIITRLASSITKFDQESLKQHYLAETKTNKYILATSNDISSYKIGELGMESSSELPVRQLYGKSSLISAFLAAAKHELIFITKENNKEGVKDDIKRNIKILEEKACKIGEECSQTFQELKKSVNYFQDQVSFWERRDISISLNLPKADTGKEDIVYLHKRVTAIPFKIINELDDKTRIHLFFYLKKTDEWISDIRLTINAETEMSFYWNLDDTELDSLQLNERNDIEVYSSDPSFPSLYFTFTITPIDSDELPSEDEYPESVVLEPSENDEIVQAPLLPKSGLIKLNGLFYDCDTETSLVSMYIDGELVETKTFDCKEKIDAALSEPQTYDFGLHSIPLDSTIIFKFDGKLKTREDGSVILEIRHPEGDIETYFSIGRLQEEELIIKPEGYNDLEDIKLISIQKTKQNSLSLNLEKKQTENLEVFFETEGILTDIGYLVYPSKNKVYTATIMNTGSEDLENIEVPVFVCWGTGCTPAFRENVVKLETKTIENLPSHTSQKVNFNLIMDDFIETDRYGYLEELYYLFVKPKWHNGEEREIDSNLIGIYDYDSYEKLKPSGIQDSPSPPQPLAPDFEPVEEGQVIGYNFKINGIFYDCSKNYVEADIYLNAMKIASERFRCYDLDTILIKPSYFTNFFEYSGNIPDVFNLRLDFQGAKFIAADPVIEIIEKLRFEDLGIETEGLFSSCSLSESCVRGLEEQSFTEYLPTSGTEYNLKDIDTSKDYWLSIDSAGFAGKVYINDVEINLASSQTFSSPFSGKSQYIKEFPLTENMVVKLIGSRPYKSRIRLIERPIYLTIFANRLGIPISGSISRIRRIVPLDQAYYTELFNDDLNPDMISARMEFITTSEISSYLARVALYPYFSKTNSVFFYAGEPDERYFDDVADWGRQFFSVGYDVMGRITEIYYQPSRTNLKFIKDDWKRTSSLVKDEDLAEYSSNKDLIHYMGHYGLNSDLIKAAPELKNTLVVHSACPSCYRLSPSSACVRTMRKGGIANIGAIMVAGPSDETTFAAFLNAIYYENDDIGTAFLKGWTGAAGGVDLYFLIGDPTLKINPTYPLDKPLEINDETG